MPYTPASLILVRISLPKYGKNRTLSGEPVMGPGEAESHETVPLEAFNFFSLHNAGSFLNRVTVYFDI